MLSLAWSEGSLALCLLLSAELFLGLAMQQAELFQGLEQPSQVLSEDSVEQSVVSSAVFSEAAPCRRPSLAHPAQFLESLSALPMEQSPLAPTSSACRPLFLVSWA